MRSALLIAMGILIGAAALGAVWAASTSSEGQADVRIVVESGVNDYTEVGLQQRGGDGAWGETILPRYRFVSPGLEFGEVRYSSAIQVDVGSRARTVSESYQAYLLESGAAIGERYSERFLPAGRPDDADVNFLCVDDLNDPGIGALCDGLALGYAGPVERIAVSDYDAFREQLSARFSGDRDFIGLFATSVPLAQIVDEEKEAARISLTSSYWIELVDPHLPEPDSLYCVISHGSDEDLFWSLSSETSVAAAGALGINLRSEVHFSGADQAEAVRRCVADGAVAIATTLAEPDALKPAVQEALTAGVPVISFNSGADDAAEVGTALHLSLDDTEAGRVAGREFNARGVEGHLLCVVHEPENQGLRDRCDGLAEAFEGTVERWSMTDRETTVEELFARLSEGDVNGVLALSSSVGVESRQAVFRYDRNLPLASFGFSRLIAEHVVDGRMMFAIFDHPEIQSYVAAVGTLLVNRLRIDPMAYFNSTQVLITPTAVNADEMRSLLESLTE